MVSLIRHNCLVPAQPCSPPHAVLLTPAVSLRPVSSRCYKPIAHESSQIPFFVFKRLRTLSFSVSCKSCVCPFENCRVCTNNSHSGTKLSALANPSSTSLNSASSAFSVISVLNPSFPFSFDCQFSTSPSRKCFPCHTSENSPVSPTIATDPKTLVSKSCICHTSETPRGLLSTPAYLLMSSFASSLFSNG